MEITENNYRKTKKTFSEYLEDIRDVSLTICYVGLAGICLTGFLFLAAGFVGMLLK